MSNTTSSRLDETPDPDESAAPVAPRPELAEEVQALLPDELINELLSGARTEEEIAGPASCSPR